MAVGRGVSRGTLRTPLWHVPTNHVTHSTVWQASRRPWLAGTHAHALYALAGASSAAPTLHCSCTCLGQAENAEAGDGGGAGGHTCRFYNALARIRQGGMASNVHTMHTGAPSHLRKHYPDPQPVTVKVYICMYSECGVCVAVTAAPKRARQRPQPLQQLMAAACLLPMSTTAALPQPMLRRLRQAGSAWKGPLPQNRPDVEVGTGRQGRYVHPPAHNT